MHHFHTKLPHQKRMLRQTEWWVQNGPITKKGVLPVTTLLFSKFCFNLKTSHYKELIWCTNDPNVYIHTFYKRWSFFWQCFLPVSILNVKSSTYYFHMKTKILADFQICISVPLIFEDFERKPFYKFLRIWIIIMIWGKDAVFGNFRCHWVIVTILR